MAPARKDELRARAGYQCLAYVSVGLALIGAVLPLVPTTPFLLMAAWSAGRGSPRVANWLDNHRHFGPMINGWQQHGAVPVAAKWLACLLLGSSWLTLWWAGASIWLLGLLAVFFILLAAFLMTRPSL